jgi:multidrug resistance efflux pump
VPVRLAIDAQPDAPVLRAGMSVHVEIDTGRQRPMPEFLQTVLRWLGHNTDTRAHADTGR